MQSKYEPVWIDPADYIEGWNSNSRELHLAALKTISLQSYQEPEITRPRGILYVGGGAYWPGIVVGIKLLRHVLKDTTPVEIWHRGDDEPINLVDIEDCCNVIVIDSYEVGRQTGAKIVRGWEQKLLALTYTNFEKVIYLDADAYLVEHSSALFQQLDSGYGFQFWQDLPHCDSAVKWPEVWPSGSNGVPAIQGGQLLINRKRAWDLICLAHWMNQHSDYYYRHLFGDQDTWRVALAVLGHPYTRLNAANWSATAFLCTLSDNIVRIVHRCQGKLMPISAIPAGNQSYNSPQWHYPLEKEAFSYLAKILQKDKRSSTDVFGEIYTKKLWGEGSGTGSTGPEEETYVDFVNFFMRTQNYGCGQAVKVVDLGCGMGNITKQIDYPEAFVVGIDCVKCNPDLNEQHEMESDNISRIFHFFDFYENPEKIPSANVLLIKDVLHHWPSEMIQAFLKYCFKSRKWDQILITVDRYQQHGQDDCHLGGYRALDYLQWPLNGFKMERIFRYYHKAIYRITLK